MMRDWLAARAAATPGREALVCGNERLTFAGLNARVARECARLHNAGMRRGQHAGMVMHSRSETVIRLFAAVRLGLVLVPLGTRQSHTECVEQLKRTECAWLLPENEGEAPQRLEAGGSPLQLSWQQADDSAGHSAFADARLALDTPLAIVHTSGTTGRPKGAVLSSGNFFHSAVAATLRLGHLPRDRWLCVMPLWHVGGLALLTRAVLQGATVVLLPRFDPEQVLSTLGRERISLVSLVPTMLHQLLDLCDGAWPDCLRLILLGGDRGPAPLHERAFAAGLPLAPTWGLTETCSQVATILPDAARYKPGSVGKPLLFNGLRVVNASGSTLPAGQTGHLLVRGPTVMQGYWNDAEASAVALRDGELHSGDLGYLDEEGDLYVVQRRADLIISGGENISPAEVEEVLAAHPTVADAVVLGLDDELWGQRVAAVLQLKPGRQSTEAEFAVWCRRRLAGFRVPREWRIQSGPLRNESGKVSRVALARLFGAMQCPSDASTD